MINKIVLYYLNKKLKDLQFQVLSLEQEIVYGKNEDKELLESYKNYRYDLYALGRTIEIVQS